MTVLLCYCDVIILCYISAYSGTSRILFKHENVVFSGKQEKGSIIHVEWDRKISLKITICHHSASLMMPNGDPPDKFVYPTLTLMIDYYILPRTPSSSTCFCHNHAVTYIYVPMKGFCKWSISDIQFSGVKFSESRLCLIRLPFSHW